MSLGRGRVLGRGTEEKKKIRSEEEGSINRRREEYSIRYNNSNV